MKVSKFAVRLSLVYVVLIGLVQTGCIFGSSNSKFADVPGLTNAPAGSGATAVVENPATGATAPVVHPATGESAAAPAVEDELRENARIKVSDMLKITFSDLPPPPLTPFEQKVKEDGTIILQLNQEFTAAGKTRTELEREIRKRYVPDLYKVLTVTVEPLSSTQFYFVDGEVKKPDRQVYISRMTVLKAIASAQGFTDFARKAKVLLTRADGRTIWINCIKAQKDPKLDLEIFPGDKIQVFRKPNPFTR